MLYYTILVDVNVLVIQHLIFFSSNTLNNKYLFYYQKKLLNNLSFRLKVVRDCEINSLKLWNYPISSSFLTSEEKILLAFNLQNFRIDIKNTLYVFKRFGNTESVNIFVFYCNAFFYMWYLLLSYSFEQKQDKFSFFTKSSYSYEEFIFNVKSIFYKEQKYQLAFILKDFNIINYNWTLKSFPGFRCIFKEFLVFFSERKSIYFRPFFYLNLLFSVFMTFTINGLVRYKS